MSARVLLISTTTGYQTRAFAEAAERLGVELAFATDRCHLLEDPWSDSAVAIRFHDEPGSVAAILEAVRERPIQGLLCLGDRPTVIAALAAEALGLPYHPPGAAAASRNKLETRRRLGSAGVPVPWFTSVSLDEDPRRLASTVPFPCVLKPPALSGSRGVIRADDPDAFVAAFERLRGLLMSADVRALRDLLNETMMAEAFVEGREFALEGILERGRLHRLALFDKPDPLDGPFFEETIYVAPSGLPVALQEAMEREIGRAAAALGLYHGPVHAECRVNPRGVFVLEVAARPIGGLCARCLRFADRQGGLISFEELLLRHALGQPAGGYLREPHASGVMMIPIPSGGIFRRVEALEDATGVPGVEEIRITAKPDQVLVPLPEGGSYLGFVFARAGSRAAVIGALREAHARLRFVIDPALRVDVA